MTGRIDGYVCSLASEAVAEDIAGTASTVRAFLLVEVPGAWGSDPLEADGIPVAVREHLRRLRRDHHIRPLLIRARGRHTRRDGAYQVYAASTAASEPWLGSGLLQDPTELLDLDLAGLADGVRPDLTAESEPLYAVCTHGRHDACCAERGRPAWEAVRDAAPERTWQVSHIGGDRFAGNALVLPYGFYYGRLQPADAVRLVAAHGVGEVLLDRLRGRSCYPFAVQFAEIAVRRATNFVGVDGPNLVSRRRDGAVTTVVFDVAGRQHRVVVETSKGEPTRLTCTAKSPEPPLRHRVIDHQW